MVRLGVAGEGKRLGAAIDTQSSAAARAAACGYGLNDKAAGACGDA
ncbi:hypothetical protein [Roseimaritima ulvae]|nr:hypothetical protein [Roseimaritima ulvae]